MPILHYKDENSGWMSVTNYDLLYDIKAGVDLLLANDEDINSSIYAYNMEMGFPVATDFISISSHWGAASYEDISQPYGSKTIKNNSGGVTIALKPCGSEALGQIYTKPIELENTSILIDSLGNLAIDGGNLALHLSNNIFDSSKVATASSLIKFNPSAGTVIAYPESEGQTIIFSSSIIQGMTNHYSTISFVIKDNTVSITVSNELGTVTSNPIQSYGSEWTDRTKAYVGFGTHAWDKAFNYYSIYVAAIRSIDYYRFDEIVNLNNKILKIGDLIIDTEGNIAQVTNIYNARQEFNALPVSNIHGDPGKIGEAGPQGIGIISCDGECSPIAGEPTEHTLDEFHLADNYVMRRGDRVLCANGYLGIVIHIVENKVVLWGTGMDYLGSVAKETWTFVLEDGTTVTKAVHIG